MYFFSAVDPNYRIKGSRDPLGFQSLWAAAGHGVVKHLSTVSTNLRDFMILSYGRYFFGDNDPRGFISFFLKFEQACAYARRIHNNETSFNGIDFVNKKANEDEFKISLRYTILSNQRAYGIYGKYIRPFRDMGISDDPGFTSIIENALKKTNTSQLSAIVHKILASNDKDTTLHSTELVPLADLIRTLTDEERIFYRKYLLQVPGENHPQNNLFEVVKHKPDLATASFQLHQLIQSMIAVPIASETLKSELTNIDNTDKVLHPLNLIFTHLLSKPRWTSNEIIDEPLFKNLPDKVNYHFGDENLQQLSEMLAKPINELVDAIIIRNEEVCKQRGNKAWIEKDNKYYKVLYGENGHPVTEINNDTGYEFPYFLNVYLSLYRQIEMS
jgi:hypothetical protein